MDGGNLGRAKFLKTVTKEQPGQRLCVVVGREGIVCHMRMDMIRTTTGLLLQHCDITYCMVLLMMVL